MNISCEQCREFLPLLLDATPVAGAVAHQLDGATVTTTPEPSHPEPSRSELEAHLATCPECAREFRFLQGIRSELLAIPATPAPTNLRLSIRATLEAEGAASMVQASDTAMPAAVAGPIIANQSSDAQTPTAPVARPHQIEATYQPRQPKPSPWDALVSWFRPARAAWAGSAALAAMVLLLATRHDSMLQMAPLNDSGSSSVHSEKLNTSRMPTDSQEQEASAPPPSAPPLSSQVPANEQARSKVQQRTSFNSGRKPGVSERTRARRQDENRSGGSVAPRIATAPRPDSAADAAPPEAASAMTRTTPAVARPRPQFGGRPPVAAPQPSETDAKRRSPVAKTSNAPSAGLFSTPLPAARVPMSRQQRVVGRTTAPEVSNSAPRLRLALPAPPVAAGGGARSGAAINDAVPAPAPNVEMRVAEASPSMPRETEEASTAMQQAEEPRGAALTAPLADIAPRIATVDARVSPENAPRFARLEVLPAESRDASAHDAMTNAKAMTQPPANAGAVTLLRKESNERTGAGNVRRATPAGTLPGTLRGQPPSGPAGPAGPMSFAMPYGAPVTGSPTPGTTSTGTSVTGAFAAQEMAINSASPSPSVANSAGNASLRSGETRQALLIIQPERDVKNARIRVISRGLIFPKSLDGIIWQGVAQAGKEIRIPIEFTALYSGRLGAEIILENNTSVRGTKIQSQSVEVTVATPR